MNLRDEILKEHSKSQALKVAAYACSSPKNFKELMQCFMADEYRLSQRAAWSVSWAAKKKPEMVKPYLKDIVAQLQREGVHDSVKRNAVRILEDIDIPEPLHGEVMNACFGFIEDPATAVAIKAFSLTTLFNLSEIYPEIRPELKLLIEANLENETAAFRSRGKKILGKLG
ncbi:MAG: hypothetical protein JO301_02505 [Chitinophagaceae bacterium]|nr:hypothetical protein [Chitinophagaceae bacterium]